MSDEPAPPVAVRSLTEGEQARMRECLSWLHQQGANAARYGDTDSDITTAYHRALAEARRRWPDVARLIGFDSDEPNERA